MLPSSCASSTSDGDRDDAGAGRAGAVARGGPTSPTENSHPAARTPERAGHQGHGYRHHGHSVRREPSPPAAPAPEERRGGRGGAPEGDRDYRVRTTTSRSRPDSAPHTSPGRPASCRTAASACGRGIWVKVAPAGSNRTRALAPQSLSHTVSRSSTKTA